MTMLSLISNIVFETEMVNMAAAINAENYEELKIKYLFLNKLLQNYCPHICR